jgi:diguanylate cyclase (GGDEF)-like protein
LRLRDTARINLYRTAVGGAGLAVFAASVSGGLPPPERQVGFWSLAILAILAEVLDVAVRRDAAGRGDVPLSPIFGLALLAALGLAAAVTARALASVAGALRRRAAPSKMAVDLGRETLALAAAAGALGVLGGPSIVADAWSGMVVAIAGAAGAMVLARRLVDAGSALVEGRSSLTALRQAARDVPAETALLAFVPPLVLIAARAPMLLPLLALPITAAARAANESSENAALMERLRHEAADRRRQALHDSLTGLPNRTLFGDRVHQAVTGAGRGGERCAVLIMDIDHFKEVNETLGHHNGDVLLQQAAGRLTRALRASDTVARLGGDEFAVLLPRVEDARAAARAAEKVMRSLEEPVVLETMSVDVGSSIGIALFPDHGTDAETLMQRADVAMYAAKQLHRGYQLYESEQDKHTADRLALAGELRHALDEDEFVLVFQPKARLDDGGVAGVEALVRWANPRRGELGPHDFIPLAEHTGLIRPLTFHVLDRALRQCRRWHDQDRGVHVAVNLSAHSLLDAAFATHVARLLSEWNVSPAWLELEITESSIMIDPYRALQVLENLNNMGVRLAIDDYGTGYSSLAYLRQLPVNAIKIDKSFVMGMTSSNNDAVIVRSTIDLARNLGLEVVAEGVETRAIWDRLAELSCDVAQGFFLARPMTAPEISSLLEEGFSAVASDGAGA